MKQSLRHITGYIQDAIQKQGKTTPPLPLSLLSLPFRQYKVFHQLVIPANDDIAVIDWALVRNDCVFILAQFIEPTDPSQIISCANYQYNQLKSVAGHLRKLLHKVQYDGSIFPILVSMNHLDIAEDNHNQVIVHINDLQPYLMQFLPDRRVMKPGLAIQLLRQVEKAMRSRAYLNKLPLNLLANLENYYWMKDFRPAPFRSSQRDFAFTQARRPQATFVTRKDK